MREKMAFFDVDKTLIDGDSMFMLLKYTLKKYPKSILGLPKLFLDLVSYKLKFISVSEAKESMFYTFNYLNDLDFEDFYKNVLLDKVFEDAIKTIVTLKDKGYRVVLVSASPECYLAHFKNEYFIDEVIGTSFSRENDRYKNVMIGENCKGVEKVKRINKYLNENDIEIDVENSVAFSDSLSDKPMFDLVNKSYIINSKINNSPYEILLWR